MTGGLAPARHQDSIFYLTVPRCIEQGRWLMRATNTGISAVIDKRGRIVMSGPQFRPEPCFAKARLENSFSPFHKLAPWEPALRIIPCLIIAWPVALPKSKKYLKVMLHLSDLRECSVASPFAKVFQPLGASFDVKASGSAPE